MRKSSLRNFWNRLIYAGWSLVYNLLIQLPPYQTGRTLLWQMAAAQPGERILLVGVGTGIDFDHLPEGVIVTGIDLSPAMLRLARRRAQDHQLSGFTGTITLLQGDAQSLPFAAEEFDLTVLALIVSVVPDPRRCLEEAVRVTKPQGRLLIFDKFLAANAQPTWSRRLANLLTRPFGTDINRKLEPLLIGLPVHLTQRKTISPRSSFTVLELHKNKSAISASPEP